MSASQISLTFPKESPSTSSLQVNFDSHDLKATPPSPRAIRKRLGLERNRRPPPKPSGAIAKVKDKASKGKYFTCRKGIDGANQRNILDEPSPFRYPRDLEEFAHKVMTRAWRSEQRSTEMSHRYYERHTCNTRQQLDLLNRLYVQEPSLAGARMIQDIDPEFYSIVEGRPIGEKLKLREYVQTVRDVLRTKILAGYRGDDIMLIDESLILEQKNIDEIRDSYQSYVNSFEDFLYNDHTESMNLLKESDREAQLAQEKYEEFKELSKEYAALRSILYSTEEKWRSCKLYQRFLYLVSPIGWRKEHDYYYNQRADNAGVEEISTIFEKYRLNTAEESTSLEDLIHQFRSDCSEQRQPELYFTDPNQLLDVFRFMELQNLNSLLHSEELAVPLENVKEGMAHAEALFNAEISSLQETIDKLAGGIQWEEERAKYLEELAMELIEGEFKSLVVAEDVLNLHVFVEDVYETRIGPNDANLSIGEMMKMIEAKFREELINLDQMPSEQVAKLEVTCYKEEAKMIREAQRAARQLQEFELLFQKLQKVFAPPYQKQGKEPKWRSPPVNPPKPVPPRPRSLTQDEKEYLEFFTQYCQYTDDPKSYGIDISPRVEQEDDNRGGDEEWEENEEDGEESPSHPVVEKEQEKIDRTVVVVTKNK